MARVRITEQGTIEAKPVMIAAGYAFCSSCGGLFKLVNKNLPVHVAVGRSDSECHGGTPVLEGEVSD
jgi:hypothetical protein